MEKESLFSSENPFEILQDWMDRAQKSSLNQPTAMVISTFGEEEDISSRVVLIKEVRDSGIVFYTNFNSRKGHELDKNNAITANIYWDPIGRQISVKGHVTKIAESESQEYWRTRPRESQISQYISRQSELLESREMLEQRYEQTINEFAGKEIPCPSHWGGYLISPHHFEFWVANPYRLHDRLVYQKVQNTWKSNRLFP